MRRTSHVGFESLEERRLFSAEAAGTILLNEDFLGKRLNAAIWKTPSFIEDGPATFYGRTQIRTSENAPPPRLKNGAVQLALDTYNPTGFSFYGSELITQDEFAPSEGKAIEVSVRAKLNGKIAPGIVGGLFLYALDKSADTHDEVDFELLSNELARGSNQVQTNIYADEPLGSGAPLFAQLPGKKSAKKLTKYHTFTQIVSENSVVFKVDGVTVRTETEKIPLNPLRLHLNLWAPDKDFDMAYDAGLSPASKAKGDKHYSMSVDKVTIREITADAPSAPKPVSSKISITHVPALGDTGSATGKVRGVKLDDYAGVAVYINVEGWWTKPDASDPLTPISSNGQWSTEITTEEFDEEATEIRAYLIPRGFAVPIVEGDDDLPDSLSSLQFASVSR